MTTQFIAGLAFAVMALIVMTIVGGMREPLLLAAVLVCCAAGYLEALLDNVRQAGFASSRVSAAATIGALAIFFASGLWTIIVLLR